MSLHPLFLRMEGRTVLVVGGGAVAREKAAQLRAAGARLRVVAPSIDPALVAIADEAHARPFTETDVDGAWLVYAAATPAVNRAVQRAADVRQRFLVSVDDVDACSAFGAAVLERGGVTLALSTEGRAPALVALLRRALEAVLPDDVEAWHALALRERARWKASAVPMPERRPLLLRALVALYPEEVSA